MELIDYCTNGGDSVAFSKFIESSSSSNIVELLTTTKGRFSRNVFHLIAKSGHEDILSILLKQISKLITSGYLTKKEFSFSLINSLNDHGFTPLYIATMNGNLSIMKILLSHDANPLICDLGGLNCYHIACEKGKVDSLGILLDFDLADHYFTNSNSNSTTSISNKNILTIRDSIGWTPLSWACHKTHADCCRHLIRYHNDHNIDDNNYIQQALSLLKNLSLKDELLEMV